MDCSEDDGHYHLTLEVPGVSLDDIELHVKGQTFSVDGIRRPYKDTGADRFHRMERFYGPFKRSISLPRPFDRDRVDARLEEGVLKVTIPKIGENHGR